LVPLKLFARQRTLQFGQRKRSLASDKPFVWSALESSRRGGSQRNDGDRDQLQGVLVDSLGYRIAQDVYAKFVGLAGELEIILGIKRFKSPCGDISFKSPVFAPFRGSIAFPVS